VPSVIYSSGSEFVGSKAMTFVGLLRFDQRGALRTSDLAISNADVAAMVCSGVEGGCSRVTGEDPTKHPPDGRPRYYVYVRLKKARDKRDARDVSVLGVYEGRFPNWKAVKRESVLAFVKEK